MKRVWSSVESSSAHITLNPGPTHTHTIHSAIDFSIFNSATVELVHMCQIVANIANVMNQCTTQVVIGEHKLRSVQFHSINTYFLDDLGLIRMQLSTSTTAHWINNRRLGQTPPNGFYLSVWLAVELCIAECLDSFRHHNFVGVNFDSVFFGICSWPPFELHPNKWAQIGFVGMEFGRCGRDC